MKLVRQPKGSHWCAQACIATLRGISLPEAVRRCGEREMVAREMVAVLDGIKTGATLLRISNGFHHWLIKDDWGYFSPAVGRFESPPPWVREASVTARILV